MKVYVVGINSNFAFHSFFLVHRVKISFIHMLFRFDCNSRETAQYLQISLYYFSLINSHPIPWLILQCHQNFRNEPTVSFSIQKIVDCKVNRNKKKWSLALFFDAIHPNSVLKNYVSLQNLPRTKELLYKDLQIEVYIKPKWGLLHYKMALFYSLLPCC